VGAEGKDSNLFGAKLSNYIDLNFTNALRLPVLELGVYRSSLHVYINHRWVIALNPRVHINQI